MDHFQVKVGKVDKPVGLLMIESLWGVAVGEILVISGDLNGKQGSMEAMSPGF